MVLLKETDSVEVTVTATANDTADGNLTLTVAGDLDGTAIGTMNITILDDETTTTTDPFLWSTTMTVGLSTGTDRGFHSDKGYGSLDDIDFTEGGNNISVTQLYGASDVTFGLSSALSDADSYILEWAGETLPLDEATVLLNGNFYWTVSWINANASSLNLVNYQTTLPVDGRVPVCLRTATEDCPEITTTTAPAIVTDGVRVTSTAATDDTYVLGETIEITVTFDNAVTVDTSGGTPRIRFRLDGGVNPVDGWAEYSSGSGGTALVFTYTVLSGDMDENGIWLPANSLELQSGTIRAAADTTVDATLTYAQPGLQSEHKVNGSLTTTTNTAATGKPAITGTPQVGQTLTAGLGTIADAEDLPSTVFPLGYSFQWVRVAGGTETNIGTNSRTYSPTSSDVDSTIRVDVSFTDGASNAETVPSDPVGPVVAAAGPCPAGYDWCTTMTVGVVGGFPLPFANFGYNDGIYGALDDTTIYYGSKSFPVSLLKTLTGLENIVEFAIDNAVEFLPRGTVFNFGGREFTADIDSEQSTVGQYEWDLPANFGWIDGQKVTVSANLAPAPESATVDGTTLVLTHSEDLDTGSTPAADRYTVKLDGGTGPDVSSVSVDTRTVTLTLATPVTAADIVTVDYEAPTSSPLQDASGLDAPDSENFPVTNNTAADEAVPVTIEAENESIGAGLEDLSFTLTREGETTDVLPVKVTIVQDQTWLSDLEYTVTFLAGEANKDLTIAATEFSFAPSTSGDLTATVSGSGVSVGGSDTVQIISIGEQPLTISYDKPEYTFAENATDVAIYGVATLNAAYHRAPSRPFFVSFSTRADTAESPEDYPVISLMDDFKANEFKLEGGRLVARKLLSNFFIVNDIFYEGQERLGLIIEMSPGLPVGATRFQMPDGTTCEPKDCPLFQYSVFITDEEDLPTLSLSAAPASIAEEDDDGTPGVAENVSTLTVSIANGETLPADRTVTLVFDGTAVEGTHYSVSPLDADPVEEDHQVVLPAGNSSVEVIVTAVANDTADRNRSVVVDGTLGVKEIGRTVITILDDETTTANIPATGKPTIAGTPQLWQMLTVGTSGIMDDDGLPASFTYRWVRVDALDNETVVGTDRTYMPTSFDVGSTIRVEVRFIDAAGNPEGPLASEATATVTLVCEADAVWCTTLTVGVDSNDPRGYCGPGAGTMHCDYGSLDDDAFTLDGTPYTVESVRWGEDNLHLTLDKDFPSASLGSLTFRIGNYSRILSNAARGNNSANVDNNYRWDTPGEIRGLPAGFAITVQLLPRVTTNLGATGMLKIEGVPQVDRTLTANVSDIRDDDGLPGTFTYQWVRVATGGVETNVGANSSSYTVSSADVGSTIRVEVRFTDLAGFSETVISDAVPVVAAAGTCPADSDWSATMTMGYVSTTSSIEVFGFDASTNFGDLDPVTFTYGSTDYTVTHINRALTTSGNTITLDALSFEVSGGDLPDGTVLNLGGTVLTVGPNTVSGTTGQEQWNFVTLGLSPTWVEDQELTVCANLPPGLKSASVDGTSLVLTYDQDLDTGSVPAADAYSVTVNGTAAEPLSVSVSGRTVTLTLANAVTTADIVTVTYTPGSNPVQDGSGLDALPLSGRTVDTVDTTAPELASAVVPSTGDRLSLTFDEDLDIAADRLPPANAFIVKVEDDPDVVRVQSVAIGTDVDNFVLSLSRTIKQGQTVTVSYTVPPTGTVIEDAAGNEALGFTDEEVTNNSTVVDARGAELDPPALVVDEGTTGSYTVELTEAPTGPVTVTVGGTSGSRLTVSASSIAFTTSNWNVKQTVNVTAGEDSNAVDETVTLTHTVSLGGGYDDVVLPDLEVTVADNDGGIVADPTALTVAEGGTGTYGLKLTRAPTSDVTVTVLGAGGAVTTGPAALTFTADNWDTAQTVTVTGASDGDKNDETVMLRHAATGGGYAVAAGDALSAGVTVTVHDDEATAPDAPDLKTAAGNESALLSWTPPGDDGGAPVTGYRYRRVGGTTEDVGAEARRATVGGLVNGTEYSFEVWAVNRVGEGARSEAKATPIPLTLTVEAVNAEVTEGEPVRYRIVMSEKTTGAVVESVFRHSGDFLRNPNTSVVSGVKPQGGARSWVVSYDTVDDAVVEKDGSFTVTIQRPAVIQLSNGENFDQYSHGQGYAVGTPSTATVKILDNDGGAPPNAPPRPGVTVVSPTMLDATWGSARENGAPVTGYILEYRAGSSGQWTGWPEAIAPAARAVRLTGLAPGTEYGVRVRAKSVRGEGPWSAARSTETAPDPEVTVSVERQSDSRKTEGATLVFTVRANPAQASALRVDLQVTETLDMLSGRPPTSVTVPAGQRSATFEVRTRNDMEDEGYSEVTAELRPSLRYLLGTAREAMYRVWDNEPDTVRGAVKNPRVEAILDPAWPSEEQALFEKPIRRLRFTWDPPTDVALAHVRGWGIHSHEVDSCSDPAPDPEDLENNKWKGRAFQATADTVYSFRARGAMYFTVHASLLGGAPAGPWSEPVCGDVAEPGSVRGGASEPVVTAARIASGADGAWSEGEVLEAVVRFSEAVTVDTTGGTPSLAIVLGDAGRAAVYAGGSGTTELVFRHDVGAADDGARGARVVAGGLALNGATIRNAAGVDAELGFALAPVVTSVAVEPDPDGDGLWSPDEAVTVTFGFSDAVTVRTEDGTPSVSLHAGGAREAAYAGGSGTPALRFAYTVTAADGPVASVLVLNNSLALNGGTIVGPTGLAAALAHAGAGLSGTPAPTARGTPALSVADASAPEGGTLAFAVTLDPAAPGAVSVDWATSDGTAKAGTDYTAASGTLVFAPGETSKTVRVAVLADEEAEGAETMVLTLSTAAGAGLADAKAKGTVSDPAEVAPAGPPPAVSIADATVDEGPGAVLAFAVTLDRASQARATVDWETRDGNARAGDDYVAGSGTLRFSPGETAKTIEVTVLDDSHDEGREVMLVVLSNPVGATIAKAAAGGTIENTDHMPQAWLGRFGRTVAEQVLEAVEERIRAAPQAGVQVTVAGQRIGAAAAASEEEARETEAQARLEDFSTWLAGEAEARESRTGSRAVAPRELLTGSSFALTAGADGIGGGLVSLWGRGALTRFDGREDELSLSGEVTGVLLGADWTRERWTMGLMLSHARGEGSYRGADSGKVSSTVTGFYPYGRYAVTDRVTVWGSAGYGAGTLTLTPEDGETLETDMDLMMAAAGLRGTVVEAPAEGGPELAVKTDALAVRTSSEATGGGVGGNLAAAEADVTRLRLGLEGTWRGLEIGTGTLVPRLELGVRHDGGDAETGFGLDLGGGLAWLDPGTGIRAEVSGRGLLTHESAGFRQRGIAGRLGWDPTPGSNRGPSLTLSQTMGVSAQGGADALLGRTTLAGLAANDNGDELERRRLEVKLDYGFGAFGNRFTATPEVGFGMSASHRDYSLVWRFVRDRRGGDIWSLEFSLEARRRESANDPGSGSGAGAEPEHGVGFRIRAAW